ncbi:GH1 family beta-glucosidase [Caulobacter sp. CCNWLY153]|uniref:GH1 family beta-glucosidase n=1 Tax=unclassified Caulobacter TaxID=2648921 RepID=UPI002FF07980
MTGLTRRGLGGIVGGVAGAAAGGLAAGPVSAAPKPRARGFPSGFAWGCATAAYQVEGAVNEDGRGQSIWDVFSHTPGKTQGGATGDVACDSYHRFGDDIGLLKDLGAKAYRFSVAWPRIFPEGRGQPNPKGVAYYDRLVDGLLAKGIEPYATLFHWDLPTALPDGWRARDTAKAFADYAGFMADKLSDRVERFMTLNEMKTFVDNGYAGGDHAPGLKLPAADVNQVRHHALLAHGLGVQAIRASARRRVQVGLAENPAVPIPAVETPENIAAARTAMRELNAGYLTAVLEGRYTDKYLKSLGAEAPRIEAGDMAAIGGALDFVGTNIYTGGYVEASDGPAGFKYLLPQRSHPRMVLPWLVVMPESLYWGPRLVSELWKPKALYITENGCAGDDMMIAGQVNDTDRLMYLRNYLSHLQRACAEGFPVKGYFLWSLMDNFEWGEGYSKRFGIHHTDYKTLKRTPKLSARWYADVIRSNALA